MTVTLVVPEQIADELFEAAGADVETAGVLLARHVQTPCGDVRLLARGIHWVPDDAYRVREPNELSIASHGYVPALAAAEADQSVPIWLHTHPGNDTSPRPSKHDEIVDEELADLFRLRSGSPLYGAVIVARTGGVSVSPATSSPLTGTPTSTAYGLPAAGSRLFRTGSTRHRHRRTSSTGTFAPSVGKSKRFSATCTSPSSAAAAPDRQLSSSSCASACVVSTYSTPTP